MNKYQMNRMITVVDNLAKNCFMLIFILCLMTTFSYICGIPSIPKDPRVSMIFTGDISFDGPVKYFAEMEKTCNYKSPFREVKRYMEDADLRIGNLECTLLDKAYGRKPAFEEKAIHHYGSKKAVEGLKYAGFDIMQLANNHISDFGSKGVESTLKALRDAGIDSVGIRNDEDKKLSQLPLIKTVNGIKIGFLAYCQNKEGCDLYQCDEGECGNSSNGFKRGPAVLDKIKARHDIEALKERVDCVVVLLHWSRELALMPPFGVRDIAMLLRIFGAQLIIGGHPHVIQGHECQGISALSVYSLGNFLFPKAGVQSLPSFLGGKKPSKKDVKIYIKSMKEMFSPTQISYMFRITVSKTQIVRAEYLPFEIKNEPNTNCLQPTPKSKMWIKFCSNLDIYCYDFRDICASSSGLQEQLNAPPVKDNSCVRNDERL